LTPCFCSFCLRNWWNFALWYRYGPKSAVHAILIGKRQWMGHTTRRRQIRHPYHSMVLQVLSLVVL
jgi:hypothetical protein